MTHTGKLTDPPMLAEFPFNIGTRVLAPGDIRSTPQQRDAYRRFTQMGDPLADAVVSMFHRQPSGQGRRMFEIALEQGIEEVENPPAELVAFFAQVDSVPYWVDRDRLDHGSRVFGRTGAVAGITSLGMFSLMGGYLASRADKTLVGTGDLDRMAPRRVAETATWTADVTAPGGLGRFASGFTSTVRVRLMHAMVRAAMNNRPDWDYQEWDQPVNQSTMAGTLLLFSLGNIVGSQALGLHFSRREKDDLYHLWRYVGFLLGVDADLLPTDEADTWRLLWLQADYEFRPDADSRKLAQALAGAIGPVLIGRGEDPLRRIGRSAVSGLMCSYSRLILGKTNADHLGLIDSKMLQSIVIAAAATNHAMEYPRRWIPGATRLHETIGRRNWNTLTKRMMAMHKGDRTYRRHDQLTRHPAA